MDDPGPTRGHKAGPSPAWLGEPLKGLSSRLLISARFFVQKISKLYAKNTGPLGALLAAFSHNINDFKDICKREF